MLKKVKEWLGRHRLIQAGETVLAACSGGPDSLALVHLLHQLAPEYGFRLAVAHVNHMFRGAEAEADAAFVRSFCAELALPYYEKSLDVPAFLARNRLSPQEGARQLRFEFLRATAAALGGAKIATGHHLDDQAETILLHLLRGSGGAGLAGMGPLDGDVIRPLLAVTRQEIEGYCASHGLQPRQDRTNFKTDYTRNKVRLQLLPLLKQDYNPNVIETLVRTGYVIGQEHEFVRQQALLAAAAVITDETGGIWLDIKALDRLHPAVQREIIRLAVEKKRSHLRGISFFHVEKVLQLALQGQTGSSVALPGLVARKEYGRLFLENEQEPATATLEPPGVMLDIPGITVIPDLGLTVTAALETDCSVTKAGNTALFDWQRLMPPLYLRTRQAGDRFRPAHGRGEKKLKEYLIDAKVPRGQRDAIPVICDDGGIIWLGGYRMAQRGLPDNATQTFLRLTIKQREDM